MELDLRFEFGISGIHSSDSLKTELAKYELDLMGVQEVRPDKGGTEPACDYSFFCGMRIIT
jgi:hypothetical protein